MESHPSEGRAVGRIRREDRAGASRSCRMRDRVLHGFNLGGCETGRRGSGRPAVEAGGRAAIGHRVLVDFARRFGAVARPAAATRRRHARRPGLRQRQGYQGRSPLVRLFRPEVCVRHRVAVPDHDRAGGELRRRRRARPHRQDLPQRLSRRRYAISRRDYGAGAEGRRAAPRLPLLHEPKRDGVDLYALQISGVRQPRLQGHLYTAAAAQGHRPWPRRGTPLRSADAAGVAYA